MSKRFHFVGGLLRSGSTLLCNILNQNPRFYVSSTSPLPGSIAAVTATWSRSPEIKGLMVKNRAGTLDRMARGLRGLSEAWYADFDKEVILDKSRLWNFHAPLISNVWPEAKLITIVRDLRSIAGSIEKQHQRTAILDDAVDLPHKTAYERMSWLFTADAPLGLALMGVEDLIRRQPKNWIALRYEDLCEAPHSVLMKLYKGLGEPIFDHDFKSIVNVAEDVDELYNLKFPHQGDGPLRPFQTQDWEGWISGDIEEQISRFTLYNNWFHKTLPII